MPETQPGWQARADELHEQGGVPAVRAQVVALRETGMTYARIADELDQSDRTEVGWHIRQYRDEREAAEWLLSNGPEV